MRVPINGSGRGRIQQIMLKRNRYFTAIHNHLTLALTQLEEGGRGEVGGGGEDFTTSHMGGCFLLELNFIFKFATLL